eukprot:TRINITY_DN6758_c0_g1_i7.p1 TRINITY_DN6758_c0_g1~~TRINITY_DN6758_c0_g1_i7.p1  ORF type:complete len:896 (+),score=238.36 TRINITY_DN6758_c0_g1_i7:80-2767(+)
MATEDWADFGSFTASDNQSNFSFDTDFEGFEDKEPVTKSASESIDSSLPSTLQTPEDGLNSLDSNGAALLNHSPLKSVSATSLNYEKKEPTLEEHVKDKPNEDFGDFGDFDTPATFEPDFDSFSTPSTFESEVDRNEPPAQSLSSHSDSNLEFGDFSSPAVSSSPPSETFQKDEPEPQETQETLLPTEHSPELPSETVDEPQDKKDEVKPDTDKLVSEQQPVSTQAVETSSSTEPESASPQINTTSSSEEGGDQTADSLQTSFLPEVAANSLQPSGSAASTSSTSSNFADRWGSISSEDLFADLKPSGSAFNTEMHHEKKPDDAVDSKPAERIGDTEAKIQPAADHTAQSLQPSGSADFAEFNPSAADLRISEDQTSATAQPQPTPQEKTPSISAETESDHHTKIEPTTSAVVTPSDFADFGGFQESKAFGESETLAFSPIDETGGFPLASSSQETPQENIGKEDASETEVPSIGDASESNSSDGEDAPASPRTNFKPFVWRDSRDERPKIEDEEVSVIEPPKEEEIAEVLTPVRPDFRTRQSESTLSESKSFGDFDEDRPKDGQPVDDQSKEAEPGDDRPKPVETESPKAATLDFEEPNFADEFDRSPPKSPRETDRSPRETDRSPRDNREPPRQIESEEVKDDASSERMPSPKKDFKFDADFDDFEGPAQTPQDEATPEEIKPPVAATSSSDKTEAEGDFADFGDFEEPAAIEGVKEDEDFGDFGSFQETSDKNEDFDADFGTFEATTTSEDFGFDAEFEETAPTPAPVAAPSQHIGEKVSTKFLLDHSKDELRSIVSEVLGSSFGPKIADIGPGTGANIPTLESVVARIPENRNIFQRVPKLSATMASRDRSELRGQLKDITNIQSKFEAALSLKITGEKEEILDIDEPGVL